jgi:hypothetical protein
MAFKPSLYQTVRVILFISLVAMSASYVQARQTDGGQLNPEAEETFAANSYYLPTVSNGYPWKNPYGFETSQKLEQGGILLSRAVDLQSGWVRVNRRISWRLLQPTPGSSIQWSLLKDFENELRTIKGAGMKPLVILNDYPYWAVEIIREDGKPASCGPISASYFPAYAQFVRAIVDRFKAPEFNVHDWELGNEPDVDPDKVGVDSQFGCWGDADEPNFRGEQYGEMLKVVYPQLKAADPAASVWIGGLLLDSPTTTDSDQGHPENFLKGILQAGAGGSFDIVAYHWYPSYKGSRIDYDLGIGGQWEAWGGGTIGKARYLRQVMQAYGVSKPLSINETGLGCANGPEDWYCKPPAGPTADFFDMQADYIVRTFTRGLGTGVSSLMWYTLNGPGWRNTALLDGAGNPRPAYYAYQVMIAQLENTRFHAIVNYGAGIEAYAFKRGPVQVHVVWSIADANRTISIPEAKFVDAYQRDGQLINLIPSGGSYQVPVNFRPIYLIRTP